MTATMTEADRAEFEALAEAVAEGRRREAELGQVVALLGATVRELQGLLRPFADAYGDRAGRLALAGRGDDDHWLWATPRLGAWRAAHAALKGRE